MPYYEVISHNFYFASENLGEAESVMNGQIGKSYQDPNRPDVTMMVDGRELQTFTHIIQESE